VVGTGGVGGEGGWLVGVGGFFLVDYIGFVDVEVDFVVDGFVVDVVDFLVELVRVDVLV